LAVYIVAARLCGPRSQVHDIKVTRWSFDPSPFIQNTSSRQEDNHKIISRGFNGCLDKVIEVVTFTYADGPSDEQITADLGD